MFIKHRIKGKINTRKRTDLFLEDKTEKGRTFFGKSRKAFDNLRFRTTFAWHQKATSIKWYKKWHEFRFSHHIHVATAIITFLVVLSGALTNLLPAPQMALAANGTWSQTTFAGSGDGTYSNTVPANGNADVALAPPSFSNGGGGSWQYRRPITVTNGSGGTLNDYQTQVQPFTDSAFVNNTGLVGSWHMNEGSGTIAADMSGNNNTGTITGATWQAGNPGVGNSAGTGNGYSLLFSGGTTYYVSTSGTLPMRQSSAITYEFWANIPSSGGGRAMGVSATGGNGSGGISMDLTAIYFAWTPTTPASDTVISATGLGLTADRWNHVVVSVDFTNKTQAIYVNGVAKASNLSQSVTNWTPTSAFNTGTTDYIGARYVNSLASFNGKLDEVKVFNRALSATEASNRAVKIRGDYADLRFANAATGAEYPYWQETDGKYWVKIDSLPNGTNTNFLNMFYGNASATASSSGTNTFDAFADFESGMDGFSAGTRVTSYAYAGVYSLQFPVGYGNKSVTWPAKPFIVEQQMYIPSGQSGQINEIQVQVGTKFDAVAANYTAGYWGKYNGGWSSTTAAVTTNSWTNLKFIHYANDTYDAYQNSTAIITGGTNTYGNGNAIQDYGFSGKNTYIDFVRVRKYASSEPTHTAPGAESGPGYVTSGTYISVLFQPTGLYGNWPNIIFDASSSKNGGPAGTYLSVQVLDSAGNAISSANITAGANTSGAASNPNTTNDSNNNNQPGFWINSGATGTIVMTNIAAATYPAIRLKATLSTTSLFNTPLLNAWSVSNYTYDATPPTVPTALTIGTVTSSAVPLSWTASTDSESGVYGYIVERAPDSSGSPGTWAQVGAGTGCYGAGSKGSLSGIITSGTSCTDGSVTPQTKYYYRIKAVDNALNGSALSTEMAVDANTTGLWHLNENTGTVISDSSPSGYTGTMNGSAWAGNSKYRSGLNPDAGGKYASMGTTAGNFGTGDFTVEMWFKGSSNGGWRWLYNKGDFGANSLIIAANDTGFRVSMGAWFTDVISGSATAVSNTDWNCIALTRSGTSVKLYLNGNQEGTTGTSSANISNASTLNIGRGPAGEAGLGSGGQIDDVRISNTARSATDILNYYRFASPNYSGYSGETNVDSNVKGLWHLNEGTGGTTADTSGNGNTGTLSNVAWSTAGKFGTAGTFNGSTSYIRSANVSGITNQLTVEAWINWTNTANWQTIAHGTDIATTWSSGYWLAVNGGSTVRWSLGGTTVPYSDLSYSFTPGSWYHIVGTYDGTNANIYMNGSPQKNWQTSNNITNINGVTIGNETADTYAFNGQIDEVRISNTARSAGNILSYYNESSPQPKYAITPSVSTPTGLTIGTVTSSAIPLSWTASADTDLDGYKIERATDSGGYPTGWAQIKDITDNAITWTDNAANNPGSPPQPNTKYYYRLRAYNTSGNNSGYSGEMNSDGSTVKGLWHLNEGSGGTTADVSGNGNTGTLSIGGSGTQTTTTQAWNNGANGRFEKSLNFDVADDCVSVPNSTSLNPTSQITVEAWVYIPSAPTTAQHIVGRHTGGSDAEGTLRLEASGKIGFLLNAGGSLYSATSTSNLPLSQWNYVVGSYDGAALRTYINGSPDGTPVNATGSITNSYTYPTYIGGYGSTTCATARSFNGQIDEVRISSVAKSAGDILTYYNESNPQPKNAYTLAIVPGTPTVTALSTTSENVLINENANPSSVTYAIHETGTNKFVQADGTMNTSAVWQTYTAWGGGSGRNVTGLLANKQYTFEVKARNGDTPPTETAYSSTAAKYTLAVNPNVSADKSASTWYNTAPVVFTNTAGFGEGGVAKYKYVWDQTSTHTFSGDGTDWSASTLSQNMVSGNSNYLHVQSYNGDNAAVAASVNYGPYYYDNSSPAGTTLSWGTIGAATINITASGAADSQSGLRGDNLTYYIERDDDATVFAAADANSGWVTGAWNQSSLSANTAYAFRVKARDNLGNETGWVTPTPAYKYTWPNAPTGQSATAASSTQIDVSWSAGSGGSNHYHVRSSSNAYATIKYDNTTASWSETSLTPNTEYAYRIYAVNADNAENTGYVTTSKYTLPVTPSLSVPATPQNTLKPTLTGTGATPSTTIRLYDNGTQMASTTADGSGNFTFNASTPGYTDFTEGNHTNITVRGYNDSGETPDSTPARTVFLDVTPPTAPTTRDAAKEGSDTGADIDDAAWNGHNTGATVYFAWSGATDPNPSSNIKRYWVYFGPLAGGVPRTDGQATADSTANAVKTLTNPVSGTDYYLRLQTEDNAGNISSDGAIPTLFVYKFDNTPPSSPTTITPTPAAWSETNSFDFAWTNWTEAHSGMDFYLYVRKESAGAETYEDFDPINRKLTDVTNPINLNDIEAKYTGTNWLHVYAVDKAGNTSTAYGFAPYFYSGTVAGPTIAADPDFNTQNSFAFTLTKPGGINVAAYWCGVESSIDATNSTRIDVITPPASVTINGKTTNVSVNGDNTSLSVFAAAKQQGVNYLYCATENDIGSIGWTTKASETFTVSTVAPGAPQNIRITDASDRGTSNWALTVGWTALTGQPPDFDGYEVWRCTSGCDNNANYSKVATVTTNIYSEAGLQNTTDYYYKIKSKDNVGNVSDFSSSVHKIPTGKYTTPPTYTSNPTSDPKATSVTIHWTTNRVSNTIVQYGMTTGYGQEASKSTEAVTDHSIEILGLTPGITYHYRVQSLDTDRDYDPALAYSTDYTFTTSQAPGISSVEVSEIRLTTAIITWKTTSSATSRILYGTSTSYGQIYTDQSSSQTTTHTVKLTGLSDSTTYNFKIQGTDIEGNILNSDNYVFTTLTFPRLSSLKVEQVQNSPTSTVKVSFASNVPATSQVTVSGAGGKEAATYTLKTEHSLTISGLRDNTPYSIIAKGRDQYGNEAVPLSSSYKTDFDTRPPQISDITVESSIIGFGIEAKGQLVISWNTDEPATSQVEYGSGVAGMEYPSRTQEDSGFTQNHVVIISDLKPSSPYHFRIVSADASENTAKSQDNSVLTEQANQSVIDLIIKSLQSTIGWIFKVFSKT